MKVCPINSYYEQNNRNKNTNFKGEFVNNETIKSFMKHSDIDGLKRFREILRQIKGIKDNAFFIGGYYNVEVDRPYLPDESFEKEINDFYGPEEDIIQSYDLFKQIGFKYIDNNNFKLAKRLTSFWKHEVPISSRLSKINQTLESEYRNKINLEASNINSNPTETKEEIIKDINTLMVEDDEYKKYTVKNEQNTPLPPSFIGLIIKHIINLFITKKT